jgi:hypothetical protein
MARHDPEAEVLITAFIVTFVGLLVALLALTDVGPIAIFYSLAGAGVGMWPLAFLFEMILEGSVKVGRWWTSRR